MKKLLTIFLVLCGVMLAQVNVSSPTTSFNQVLTPTKTTMVDFISDQQTGQGQDDFVVNGFYVDMLKPFLAKNRIAPTSKANFDDAAGAEGDTTSPTVPLFPVKLPTEYTVSPANLTRPVSY